MLNGSLPTKTGNDRLVRGWLILSWLLEGTKIAALAAAVVLLVRTPSIWESHSDRTRNAVVTLGTSASDRLIHTLDYRLSELQKATEHKFDSLQRAAVGQVRGVRGDLTTRLDVAGQSALGEIKATRGDLNRHADRLELMVGGVTDPIHNVVQTFDRQFMQPTWTDPAGNVHGNPNTLWAGYAQVRGEIVPTLDSLRRTMQSIDVIADIAEERAPQVADATVQIGEGVGKMATAGGRVADEFTKPKRWYRKVGNVAGLVARGAAGVLF